MLHSELLLFVNHSGKNRGHLPLNKWHDLDRGFLNTIHRYLHNAQLLDKNEYHVFLSIMLFDSLLHGTLFMYIDFTQENKMYSSLAPCPTSTRKDYAPA